MGTFTNFIKLHKPGETEKYNINVFNANAELIDSALARMEQENESRDNLLDTLKTKATDLVDGLLSKEPAGTTGRYKCITLHLLLLR